MNQEKESLALELKGNFLKFCKFFKHDFSWLNVQEKVCEIVSETCLKDDGRLLMSIAPGIGKSTISSQLLPAWLLARNPQEKIIIASYGASLSDYHGKQVRSIVQSEVFEYLFGVLISRKGVTGDFETDSGGFVICRGRDGAITGRRATTLILDDTIKSQQEAESDKVLASVWDFFSKVAYTRLVRGGSLVCFNTRWTSRDLIGRLSDLYPDWNYVNIQAIYDGEGFDLLGRNPGEHLGDDYMTLDSLKLKQKNEPNTFINLYQGNPINLEKSPIKKSSLIIPGKVPEGRTGIITAWDTASVNSETADYTVCTVWKASAEYSTLISVYRERVDFPNLVKLFENIDERYSPKIHIIEKASSGLQLLQVKQDNTIASSCFKESEKYTYAEVLNYQLRIGKVQILKDALSDDLIEEVSQFVYGKHDDVLMSMLHYVKSYGTLKVRGRDLWAVKRARKRGAIRFKF